MEQLKTGFSDPNESDILHTLRWSSRLRVSTYVNWIKVCKIVQISMIDNKTKLLYNTKFVTSETYEKM